MTGLAFLRNLNRMMMVLAAFWAFILAVLITVDVTGRGLFNAPLVGTVEIIKNSIVVMVFLQAGYIVQTGSMLRADFLVASMGPRLTAVFDKVSCLAGAALFGLIVYGCVSPMMRAWSRGEFEGEGALRIVTWPIYAVIIFGSAMAALNYVLIATGHLVPGKRPEDLMD